MAEVTEMWMEVNSTESRHMKQILSHLGVMCSRLCHLPYTCPPGRS